MAAEALWIDIATRRAAEAVALRELRVIGLCRSPFGIVNALFEQTSYVATCMSFSAARARRYCDLRALQIARYPWPFDLTTFVTESVELLTKLSKEESDAT